MWAAALGASCIAGSTDAPNNAIALRIESIGTDRHTACIACEVCIVCALIAGKPVRASLAILRAWQACPTHSTSTMLVKTTGAFRLTFAGREVHGTLAFQALICMKALVAVCTARLAYSIGLATARREVAQRTDCYTVATCGIQTHRVVADTA